MLLALLFTVGTVGHLAAIYAWWRAKRRCVAHLDVLIQASLRSLQKEGLLDALIAEQRDLPEKAARLLNENLWDLYDDTPLRLPVKRSKERRH